MKAINIEWSTDGDATNLPTEVKIPPEVEAELENEDNLLYINAHICDWLTDTYGYCIQCFMLVK